MTCSLRLDGAVLGALMLVLPGCNIVGPLGVLLSPPQIKKADFKLTHERLAVLIDVARAGDENSVFTQAFHDKLVEIFREKKVNSQVVPATEVLRLRQTNPDFARWNLQRVATALGAEQVLCVRIERLSLRTTPEHPVLEPFVEMRVKVVGRDAPAKSARLWPGSEEREGREISRARLICEATDPTIVDSEAAKLGKDAAVLVAMPFYDVDTEAPVPWEK